MKRLLTIATLLFTCWSAAALAAPVELTKASSRTAGKYGYSWQDFSFEVQVDNLAFAKQVDIYYRDSDGQYDAIASIEMFEAVGEEYWPAYFQSVNRLLKTGGKAAIQTIVIQDELFDRYLQSTDFIQQYVFPGGCLLSVSEFKKQCQQVGLEVIDEMRFGQDYRETLKRWREQFMAQQTAVLSQNFDQKFIQIWEFYLAYCEAAFQENNTDVVQFTLQKSL